MLVGFSCQDKHPPYIKSVSIILVLVPDVDECVEAGGLFGHHCHSNTRCVNVVGGYVCQCLPGYTRRDKFNCVEVSIGLEIIYELTKCVRNSQLDRNTCSLVFCWGFLVKIEMLLTDMIWTQQERFSFVLQLLDHKTALKTL